jgi:hypothetical protein
MASKNRNLFEMIQHYFSDALHPLMHAYERL